MAYCYPKGRVWYIGYVDANGEHVRVPTKILVEGSEKSRAYRDGEFRAETAARELEDKAWHVRAGLAEADVAPIPFEQLCEKYIAIRVMAPGPRRKKSHATIVSRVRGHIIPHFRGRLVHLIKGADVDEFLNLRGAGAPCVACGPAGCGGAVRAACPCTRKCHHPASLETLDKLRNHLSAIFRFGIEGLGVLKENPVARSAPIEIPKTEPTVVEQAVLEALLRAELDVRGIFAVCIYTGVRKIEALRIKVDDVNLERHTIIIRAPKVADWRPVPIPPGLVPYLELELERARGEWLFVDPVTNKPRRQDWKVENRIRTTLIKAGIVEGWAYRCVSRGLAKSCGHTERWETRTRRECPKCRRAMHATAIVPHVTLKDLRSTFATLAYEETEDSKFVQRALGHGDGRTTDRYVKMRQKQLVQQGAKLKLVGGGE